jgi:hypothetical protein
LQFKADPEQLADFLEREGLLDIESATKRQVDIVLAKFSKLSSSSGGGGDGSVAAQANSFICHKAHRMALTGMIKRNHVERQQRYLQWKATDQAVQNQISSAKSELKQQKAIEHMQLVEKLKQDQLEAS